MGTGIRTDREIVESLNLHTYRRFDDNCNKVFRVQNITDLTPKVIYEFIKEHEEKQRPRLDILDDYYQAHNRAILDRPNRESHLADYRASHAYPAYISNFMQGFMVGVPIRVEHKDEAIQQLILNLNKYSGIDKVNSELILDLSIYGRAYDLVYRSKIKDNSQDRVVLLSPLSTFVIYDDTVEKQPLMGVRYNILGTGVYTAVTYTDDKIVYYSTAENELKEERQEAHYYKEQPITEYSNNRFRQGDFERVLDLIDLYDASQSDTANYMTDLNDALLVITGDMNINSADAQDMKSKRTLVLRPSYDDTGRLTSAQADYKYKQYDVSGVEAYKTRLQSDIHKFTNTPDLNDMNFSGNTSGEAMKYKLFGLDQIRATKQVLFVEGMMRRYRLLFNLGTTAQELSEVDLLDLEFVFTPNLPKSVKEQAELLQLLGGGVTEETALKLSGLVDDTSEELKKKEKEEEDSIIRMQETMSRINTNTDIGLDTPNRVKATDGKPIK